MGHGYNVVCIVETLYYKHTWVQSSVSIRNVFDSRKRRCDAIYILFHASVVVILWPNWNKAHRQRKLYGSWIKTVVINFMYYNTNLLRVGIVFTVKFQWFLFSISRISVILYTLKNLLYNCIFSDLVLSLSYWIRFLKLQMCVLLRHNYNSPIAIIQCKHKRIMQFLFTDSLLIIVIW